MNGDLQPDPSSSLHSLVGVLRRRLWVVVVCLVVVPASAYAFSASREKEYAATASLLFRAASEQRLGNQPPPQPSEGSREAATNLRLVSLKGVAERTAKALDEGVTPEAVAEMTEVSAGGGESDIVDVKATSTKSRFAAAVANTFARQYIAFRRNADRNALVEARRLIDRRRKALGASERDGPGGRELKQRADELDVLSALQTGNAELVQAARVPTAATSPRPVRDAVLGVVLGAALALGLAFLLELLDRRLKDQKEIKALFERPTLGAIPESRTLAKFRSNPDELDPRDREAFRMLSANLRYFTVDHEIRSVLVNSAAIGDGKTTVAWNLAVAVAETGAMVLLLEADLRNPVLAASFNVPAPHGLTDILTGEAKIADAILQMRVANGSATIDVIVAGSPPPNPRDLIGSRAMRDLIAGAEQKYDLVVIDPPPTTVVSDAIPLIQHVSGVVVVSRLGKSTRDASQHLHSQLLHLDARVLGVVINGISQRSGYYSNEYGDASKQTRRLIKAAGGSQ